MKPEFFISRPVLSTALSLLILFAGLFAIFKLPLRLFPKIDSPVISISTVYPGASPQVVQSYITSLIQNAIEGIDGVNTITSSSEQGASEIQVQMQLGENSDTALTNIMQKVASVRGQLPVDAFDPVISKGSMDGPPTFILAFTSQSMPREALGDYLTRNVQPKLEGIDGVANAQVEGSSYAMRVWLNPSLMAAHGVAASEVADSITRQNSQAAPGSTSGRYVSFNLNTTSTLSTAQEFSNIVIKNQNNTLLRLGDIGKVELGDNSNEVSAYFNGLPAALVMVSVLPANNPLTVVNSIYKMLPNIERSLPDGVQMHEVVNAASYIHSSVDEVIRSMLETILIVVAVIYMFIGSWRAVLIPIVTIPLSLVGICFFMMQLNFSINILTLLAMVLAIGLVVDDAIVVVENIFRYIEKGMSPFKAAIQGSREIMMPIIAMTITLAAVFSPIAFIGGLTGQLFTEFAFTLAGSVVISGFIALTLSPMMCAHLLSAQLSHNKWVKVADELFRRLKEFYGHSLRQVLAHKKILLGIWLVSLVSIGVLYKTTPAEVTPKEDQGYLHVLGSAPDYTNSDFLDLYSQQLNDVFKQFPEIQSYVYLTGIPSEHQVVAFTRLKPWNERKRTATQLQPLVQAALSKIPGLQTYTMVPSMIPGASKMPIQFVITSTGSYQSLYEISQKILQNARQSGLFLFISGDLDYDQPQLQVDINRDAAAALNVDISQITKSLALMLGGNQLQEFSMNGRSYPVILQVPQDYRLNPASLNNIFVRASNGKLIPLANLVNMHTEVIPGSLNQFQKFNAVTLSGMMSPHASLSQCLHYLTNQADQILPRDMSYDFGGMSRQYIQEGNKMLMTFGIAILIIFIVLSIQFESYRDSLIILLGSVPMAIVGALLPLKFGLSTLNIFTQIGLLTLVGLVSKHGILMTKFANELQMQGLSKLEAIQSASSLRLRPILMTSGAIIFGALPLICATGAGSASRFAMGIVILVGMLMGTLFTLYLVPSLYVFMAKEHKASVTDETLIPTDLLS